MQNVYGLMREHFEDENQDKLLRGLGFSDRSLVRHNENEPIIVPKKSTWKHFEDDEARKLGRTFTFRNTEDVALFMQFIFDYEIETAHHGKHVIEFKTVTTEVWTHLVNEVTSVDKDYAKALSRFFEMVGGAP